MLGPERFLREIEIAANLQHPHILPLSTPASAGGFLYYVMPFVEGESLRARLEAREAARRSTTRSGSRPRSPTRWTTRTAAAWCTATSSRRTSCSHDGHAMVADFGIARAIRAAGGERLTQTGR